MIVLDTINISIGIVTLFVVGIGGLTFVHNRKSLSTKTFFLFTIAIVIWCWSMILFRSTSSDQSALLLAQFLYFSAPVIPFIFVYFTNVFPVKKDWNWLWHSLIIPLSFLIITFISIVPGMLIESVDIVMNGENRLTFNAVPYFLYSLFVSVAWGLSYIFLIRSAQTTDERHRRAAYIVLIGVIISTMIAVVGNLILPFFGIFSFNWIGQAGCIFMVGFTGYSIVQYGLFDIKVISAELLTFVIWVILAARIFLSNNINEQVVNGVIFLFVFIAGIFLIRSVKKEVENRERLEKLTGDLKVANQQLKKLDSQKSQMLSIASHQFRAPLTAIKGYASLVTEGSYGEVKDSVRESVERIATSAENLDHVVNDFLNVSRIDQGRMDYDFTKKDLRKIVSSVYKEAEVTASQADLKLTFLDDGSDNYIARADEGKLRQVIVNLVDNAIKYTLEGGEIRIIIARTDKPKKLKDITSDVIRISVEDDGIGIEEGTEKAIFEQFSRADGANDVNVIGTGLGLFVAQEIIQAHGGRIWAESKGKGKGSTFFVELPAAA